MSDCVNMSDITNIADNLPNEKLNKKLDDSEISMDALVLMMNLSEGDFIINVPLVKDGGYKDV